MPAHGADRFIHFGDAAVIESAAKYGGYRYTFDFVATKDNLSWSSGKSVKAKLKCSDEGAQFYIPHRALPFMRAGGGSYFVVRGPYGVEGVRNADFCATLAAVRQGALKQATLRLHTLPGHWRLNAKNQLLEAQGGSNNLFMDKYEVTKTK